MSDIWVDDVTGSTASDLVFSLPLHDVGAWYAHNNCRITGTNHVGVACSFRKTGPGTLEFSGDNRLSDWTGPVEVAQGTLKVNYANSDWNRFYNQWSPLGNTEKPHTITVHSGAALEFASADIMGQLSKNCPGPMLVVSNATLKSGDGCCNGLPKLRFFNANYIYGNGSLGARQWGISGFNSLVEFDGDNGVAYDLPNVAQNNWLSLGYGTDLAIATNAAQNAVLYRGFTEMRVHDVTGNADVDVTIRPVLQYLPDWPTRTDWDTVVGKGKPVYFSCGLRKTGAGMLRVTNTNTYTGDTEVVEGAFLVDSPNSKSPVRVKTGAFLGGSGRVPQATVEAGGGFTAAPGQTGALTVDALTLPSDNRVALDVAYAGDVTEVPSYEVPVVKADGLANAVWTLTYNGGEPPVNYRLGVQMKDGVVYGRVTRSGLTVTVR